jgi:hypothetical protein
VFKIEKAPYSRLGLFGFSGLSFNASIRFDPDISVKHIMSFCL